MSGGEATRVEALVAGHGRGPAVLDGIGATFPSGAVTVVAGRNAAGKTTLLRCLAGLMRPRSGRVIVGDRPGPHAWPAAALAARIAFVPQEPQVAAAFTVREVVGLGRHALGPDPAAVARAIDRLGLADRAEVPWPALSGGGRRRTALARALAQVAADGLLLLDEPTAGLDLDGVRLLAGIVRDHAAGGGTAVLVLHDLAFALGLADRLILLDAGRVALAGPPAETATPDALEAVFGVGFEAAPGGPPRPRLLERG